MQVSGGVVGFSTVGTGTDGPGLPSFCDEGFGVSFDHDAWLCYTSDCNGVLTIDSCRTANFDVRMAVYAGCSCPPSPGDLLACNDDGSGCGDFGARLSVGSLAGQAFLIRVGGFCEVSGTGSLLMSCSASGDANCDGSIDDDDIEAFVTALLDPASFAMSYPYCGIGVADANGDGSVDGLDAHAFVAVLLGG